MAYVLHVAGAMQRMMDALELLVAQHEAIDRLLARTAAATEANEKMECFGELVDKLVAHAEVEEQLFFPVVHSSQTATLVSGAVGAHGAMRYLLADMIDLDPMDRRFDERLAALTDLIAHQAQDQGEELFPIVDKQLSRSELAALGGQLAARFAYPVELVHAA
jgi:hemerythrin-like domain-containing protein